MAKPLIGITTAGHINEKAGQGARFMTAYVANIKAIERAGGLPILIPCDLELENLREVYQLVDGLLLPGGGDVDPVNYDAERHPKTQMGDLRRDVAEISIAQWAAQEDRPLFGICRGQQVVNVALGGTLIQDIPSLVASELSHDFPEDRLRNTLSHAVRIEPDSRLHQIVAGASQSDKNTLLVNSLHHQAIGNIAPALKPTAWAADGIIEAAELPGSAFYHTVQWHPEDLTNITEMQSLFDALVQAAAKAAQQKATAQA